MNYTLLGFTCLGLLSQFGTILYIFLLNSSTIISITALNHECLLYVFYHHIFIFWKRTTFPFFALSFGDENHYNKSGKNYHSFGFCQNLTSASRKYQDALTPLLYNYLMTGGNNMDWITGLQRAIDYTEAHLTEEIDESKGHRCSAEIRL